MSARLTFLLGRADTGKSACIVSALRDIQRSGKRAVLIVPEQYTFEAERTLSAALGGILGVQVLSFQRLNQRILTLHGMTRPFLSAQGHRMVIRRAVQLHAGELTAFGRVAERPGFAEKMQEVFSDVKRAGMDPEALFAVVERLPENTPLRDKLSDIALLYRETEEFLRTRYLTTDDAVNAGMALLPESFLAGLPVFIDGVDRPSFQQFRWLSALLSAAGSVTVALSFDPCNPPDAAVFEPDLAIYTRLTELAERMGCPVENRYFRDQPENRDPAIAHLERNLFAYPAKRFDRPTKAVAVFGATDRVAEAEALADEILRCARSGLRYREMAVIVSDPEAYMPLLTRVFQRRGIPAFLDRKRPVTGHAAVDAAVSALAAVSGEYRAADVLRLVKTGCAGVADADGEALEQYLVRTGVTGSGFLSPFTRGEVTEGAERARQAVMGPLKALQAGLRGRTVSEKVRALYEYLTAIGLKERLTRRTEALLAEGRIQLMEEHAQVWNALMGALSQMDGILGDLPMGRSAFSELFTEGLAGWELGVIPGTSDQVLLGDVTRTKSRMVRALFVAGVNEGLLPATRGDDGLIDDSELAAMEKAGASVWEGSEQRGARDRLDLYTALSKARERVFFSYCFSADGAELSPSPLVGRIRRLFPRCRTLTDLAGQDPLPMSRETGLRALAADIRALYGDGTATPRLPVLLDWYSREPAYAQRVRRMLSAGRLRHVLAPLGREGMRALYGERIPMSASRLEQFSVCPFKHFVRYGLGAEDKKAFEERAVDLGTLYHAALDAFTKRVLAEKRDWAALTEMDVAALLDEILPAVFAAHNGGIYITNERLRATLALETETIRQSAMAIVRQVAAGSFTPMGSEVRFGEGQAFPPIPLVLPDGTAALLSGVIDRVDGADVPGGRALRVVDYKTGGREFDFMGILSGLTLQLPLYLSAALSGAAGHAPGGMYYMPLRVPAPEEGADPAAAMGEAFRLRGLTLSDPAVVRAGDPRMEGASKVLKGVKTLGEDGYSGTVCTGMEMRFLLDKAKQVAERAFCGMLDGHIEINPAEGACAYCDYRSVCRFDPSVPGNKTRKFDKLKMADFFALMGGDSHALD